MSHNEAKFAEAKVKFPKISFNPCQSPPQVTVFKWVLRYFGSFSSSNTAIVKEIDCRNSDRALGAPPV